VFRTGSQVSNYHVHFKIMRKNILRPEVTTQGLQNTPSETSHLLQTFVSTYVLLKGIYNSQLTYITLQRNTKFNSWQDLTMHILQSTGEQKHNLLFKADIKIHLLQQNNTSNGNTSKPIFRHFITVKRPRYRYTRVNKNPSA